MAYTGEHHDAVSEWGMRLFILNKTLYVNYASSLLSKVYCGHTNMKLTHTWCIMQEHKYHVSYMVEQKQASQCTKGSVTRTTLFSMYKSWTKSLCPSHISCCTNRQSNISWKRLYNTCCIVFTSKQRNWIYKNEQWHLWTHTKQNAEILNSYSLMNFHGRWWILQIH